MPTLFCLATAEAHGLPMKDLDRRRTLVLAVLLGNSGSGFIQKAAGRTGPYSARTLVKAMPLSAINIASRVLGPRFITKWGTQQGILVLSRDLQSGIGAGIGAGGNAVLGRMTLRSVRKAFGPPPASRPDPPAAPAPAPA